MTYFVNSREDHDVVFTLQDITVTQVLSIPKRVSPNKSAGIDGINARLLRLAALVITLSIVRIIDHAFSTTGNFPHRWKPLKLPLCLKKVMQVTHLIIVQFLSSQSYLLKIIERYVHDSLYDFFQVIYLGSPVFVSTMVLRLLCLKMKIDELLLNLDNNRVSGVLLVDYCKAFDMVDHNL